MDKVRLGIVGCGMIAGRHLNGYRTLYERGMDSFTIDAVCDVSLKVASDYAIGLSELPCGFPRIYDNVDEMISSESIDGVDICVPHGYHHTTAIPFLESGVDVMIEKPLGTTIKASRKIIDTADKHGRMLAVAENCRRTPGARAVRWAFNEGNIVGEPRMFFAQSAHWHPPYNDEWSWRLDKKISGGGLLMDGGIHMMDVMRYIFGEVDHVYAEVRQVENRFANHETGKRRSESEDTWVAVITFENGVIGTWSWTVAAPGADHLNMTFYGSDGLICYDGDDTYPATFKDVFHPFMIKERGYVQKVDGSRFKITELGEMYCDTLSVPEIERLFPFGIEDSYALEVYDFIDSIMTGRSPEVDGRSGLQSKAIAIALYESGYSGESVKIADVLDGHINGYQHEIDEYWGL